MNEQKQAYDRQSYAFWKARGLCADCHGRDAYTLAGRSRCAACTEKIRTLKQRYRNENRERLARSNHDWYYRMKAEGRCVKCGREVEEPSHYTTCAMCRAKQRAEDAERRLASGKIPKAIAADCGVCGICNRRPAMEGRKTCPECYAQNMRNLDKANAAKEGADHPWRRMAHAEAVRRAAG